MQAAGILPHTIPGSRRSPLLTLAGVAVAKHIGGCSIERHRQPSALLYACRQEGEYTQLYQIDAKSMECSLISSRKLPESGSWAYTYVGSISGVDYLFEHSYANKTINLLEFKAGQVLKLLSDFKFPNDEVYPSLKQNYFVAGDKILIAANSQYYLLDQRGLKSQAYPAGTQVLDFDGTSLLTQSLNPEATIISCLRASDGSILDSYSAEQDLEYFYRSLDYSRPGYNGTLYYGEAGLYLLETDSHRLKNRSRPAPLLDITSLRNDQQYIILTHDPGYRVYGQNRMGETR